MFKILTVAYKNVGGVCLPLLYRARKQLGQKKSECYPKPSTLNPTSPYSTQTGRVALLSLIDTLARTFLNLQFLNLPITWSPILLPTP